MTRQRAGWQPDTRRGRRLFVAVPVSEPVRASVAAVVAAVRGPQPAEAQGDPPDRREERRRRDVRWVRLDGIHLTVRFLGPTPEPRVADVAEAVRTTAAHGQPFAVRLSGAGGFPSPEHARTLWLGVTEGAPEIGSIARALDDRLERIGWPRDDRPFRAHLTLARADGVPDVRRTVDALVAAAAGLEATWEADRLVLFESHTGNGPARYEAVVEAPFGG